MNPFAVVTILAVVAALVCVAIKRSPVWLRLLCVGAAFCLLWLKISLAPAMEHHKLHGIMNGGVGRPYKNLAAYLKTLAEQDKHEELKSALITMDANSRSIFSVWLSSSRNRTFEQFVSELIRTNAAPPFRLTISSQTNAPAR